MATLLAKPTTRRTRISAAALGSTFDILVVLAALVVMVLLWSLTATSVAVTVDGLTDTATTHRRSVGALLTDLNLQPTAQDRVSPPPNVALSQGLAVSVERARPVRILVDGQDVQVATWGATVGDALLDAGVTADAYDQVYADGEPASLGALLPAEQKNLLSVTYDRGYSWDRLEVEPVTLQLRRAIPIIIDEGGLPYEVRTTAETVGEALRQADVTLYLGDRVHPSLGSGVTASLRVTIQRSTPMSLQADGRMVKTRTRAKTVGDALAELGVVAAGLDRVTPPLETSLYPDIRVIITRIREDIEIEEEIEPFETVFRGAPNLLIDTQELVNEGAPGIKRKRYRVRYEDGEAVSRTLEDEWLAQSPEQRVIAYGQRIDPQVAVVDGQSITYWRKVRMLATSYNAGSAGGSRTYTGDEVRQGVVAVDPAIVPLRSQVFVPGYGVGHALDTGGGIRSRRIDLAYDVANYRDILRWVDVYLLWPPPSADRITWVVPNYPRPPED
jgi:uncharacterized protein YabE (DUF348 family)